MQPLTDKRTNGQLYGHSDGGSRAGSTRSMPRLLAGRTFQ